MTDGDDQNNNRQDDPPEVPPQVDAESESVIETDKVEGHSSSGPRAQSKIPEPEFEEDHGPSTPQDFIPALKSNYLANSPFFTYIRSSEFKRLLGQVTGLVDRNQVKTLAILSAYPQEGRTFFVSALALGYAILLKKRVLVVNTALKLRADSLNIKRVFDEELRFAPGPRRGGSDRMIDLMSPEMNSKEESQADTVDFQIGNYISTFRHNYDLTLIDNCALTVTNEKIIDPIVIAGQADASILITSEKSMRRGSLSETKDLLTQWRVRVVGAIHNEHVRQGRFKP